jgi:hypothetical protein
MELGVYLIDRLRVPFLICAIEGKDAAKFDDLSSLDSLGLV